ncbi:MAG: MCE family protein [Nocardia sp.]|nr:MCE family protein [Nocardia sp.]
MINRTLVSVIGMVTIAAGSFGYMYKAGMPFPDVGDFDTVTMSLPDTNGLVVGSPVLLRGISIGTISKVRSSADAITVQWQHDKKYPVPVASDYRVDNLSALGESYIAVLPTTGGGPYLGANADLRTTKVVVPPTIKELSARLTHLLEQVDPNRIADIFREMNVALPDDVDVLGNLSHAGTVLANVVNQQAGSLTKLLSTIQPLLRDSSWMRQDLVGIGRWTPNTSLALSHLYNGYDWARGFGMTQAANEGATPVLEQTQKFLDDSSGDLQTLGVDLLPGTQAGAAALRTVDVGRFLDNALAAVDSGNSLTVHVQTPGR